MDSLGTLVGGIAHNFNNLLLPIMTLTSVTLKKLPRESKERKDLESIITACEQAKDLVNRVMVFSRYDRLDKKEVHIHEIIEECLLLLRSTVPASVKITQHLEPVPDKISVDPSQIQTVMINLVSNAVDAMDRKNGEIEIALSRVHVDDSLEDTLPGLETGPYAKLTVADDGPGMDEKTLSRIFDPFFTTKEVGKGTGLGLSTAFGIITRHGGSIRATSVPGRGSTFDVYLPLVEEKAA